MGKDLNISSTERCSTFSKTQKKLLCWAVLKDDGNQYCINKMKTTTSRESECVLPQNYENHGYKMSHEEIDRNNLINCHFLEITD